jgi:NAD+ synthetase
MNYEKAIANIRKELKGYIRDHNIQSLVIGISGGMDSCLCAALAKPVCDKLNIPLIGRSLPISTNAQDEIERARLTGKVFCTDFQEINLFPYYERLSDINFIKESSYELARMIPEELSGIEKASKIRNGNIKARLRMIYLYNLASAYRGMVLSTDNYTEYLLGFSTIMGDWGDFGMIQYLWKSEVYDMAEWLMNNEYIGNKDTFCSLKESIEALATDGLGVTNRGDLGQIMPEFEGSSRDGYKIVDIILDNYINHKSYESTWPESHPVIQRHLNSHFKRNWPITIKRNTILDIS